MNRKTVVLERAQDKEGRLGSFGFSVLGGHGTKYPAVVCDVESRGPAHLSRMVQVGDRLLSLNGEELLELTSKDLVQRIRTAPSPSTFVVGEDEPLRQQVLALLRKQERRAAAKRAIAATQGEGGGGGETGELRSYKKGSVVSLQGEERRKKKEKIIEVEPSVNIESGQNTDIVQVLDNKIIGRRADQPVLSPDHLGSRENSPFKSYPSSGRHHSPSPSTGSATSSGSPRRQRQRKNLEQQTAISPPRVSGSSQSGLDSVSLQSASSGGSGQNPSNHTPERENVEEKGLMNDGNVVIKELNGEVQSVPVSHSYTETLNEQGLPVAVVSSASCEFPSMEGTVESLSPREQGGESSGDQDSGISLQIPSWKGPPMLNQKQPRSSLAEEILVTELQQQSLDDMRTARDRTPPKPSPLLKDATPPPDNLPAIPESPKTPTSPQADPTRKHRSTPSRSSSKRKSNPYTEAVSLARHLYMLDGYKKSEVAGKLADLSDFGKMVVKEYLSFFEFEKLSLLESLRQFLLCFSLTGESQERERIMIHFSDRYFECNPDAFTSVDIVHGMTVALLLLNTDLHTDHGSQKMSFSQFVNNLQGIGVALPRDVLRKNYESIRKVPLEWAADDVVEEPPSTPNHTSTASGSSNEGSQDAEERTYHVTIPGTFVEVEMPGSAPLYKEGFVLRKNIMDGPHKKVSRGKRNWKQYYAYLKGFLLYFGQPQGELHLEDTSSAISVCHCLAMGASDYHKKSSVFRVTTSDWQSFLLQASSIMDMQQWIGAINKAAARYSSPPLAAPVSSSRAFQRPTFPLAPTKNTLEQQIEHHEAKMKTLDSEVKEHQAYKPKGNKVKHSQLQSWFDKYEFLQYEVNRFRIYYASLTSDIIIDYNAPLPSGLVPSPSISTLATSSTDQDHELYKGMTPPHSPISSRHKFQAKSKNTGSPLVAVASHSK